MLQAIDSELFDEHCEFCAVVKQCQDTIDTETGEVYICCPSCRQRKNKEDAEQEEELISK